MMFYLFFGYLFMNCMVVLHCTTEFVVRMKTGVILACGCILANQLLSVGALFTRSN